MKDLLSLTKYIKPYWKQSIGALSLLLAIVLMDLAIPRLIQQIIDQGILAQNSAVVLNTTLIMLGLSLTSMLFAIGMNYLSVYVGENFAKDLRENLFLRIQSYSFGNLDNLRTGELIVRLTSDVSILQRVTRMMLRIGTRAPFLMVGSLILMFRTNFKLALSILPLLLIATVVIVIFVSKLGTLFMLVQKKLDRLNTVLQENIAGVRVVKAFVRAIFEKERFNVANDDYAEQSIKVMRIMSTVFPVLMTLLNAGIVLVIWMGGIQFINDELTLGEIVAFTNYLLTTMTPLMISAMLAHMLAHGVVSAERVNEILLTEPEVIDSPDAIKIDRTTLGGTVTFNKVRFHYNGSSNETVLEDINFTAEPGETLAILGATGSGKSTLLNLIPRFYDIAEGSITVDDVDVRDIEQDSLLAQISIVPQETVLFSGSILENIRYGKPEATEEEVIRLAKAAQAHDFITELPDGYYTNVDQRGVNLSGGQKQRIAIARALLTFPRILLLDDSTSSVDVKTENLIQEAMKDLIGNTTTIIVAQRISTVLNADRIVIMDKGRVSGIGTHSELLENNEIYKEIYESQLGGGFSYNDEEEIGEIEAI